MQKETEQDKHDVEIIEGALKGKKGVATRNKDGTSWKVRIEGVKDALQYASGELTFLN